MITPEPIKKRYWQMSDFWKDAGERIVTAFIEGTIGLLTIDILTGPRIDMGLKYAIMTGGVMSVLSTIKAIVGAQRKNATTPVSII